MLNAKQNYPAAEKFDGLWNTINELQMSLSNVQSLSELCHLIIVDHDFSEEQKAALSKAASDKALDSWKLTQQAFKDLSGLRDEIRKAQAENAIFPTADVLSEPQPVER